MIDPRSRPLYSENPPITRFSLAKQAMNETELKHLERRVDELLQRMAALKHENRSLRENQAALLNERARLIEKTELARSRVEAMIGRLKTMEQES